MTGKFIVVEGLEGAGKTTAMQTIQRYLEQQGLSVIMTREPGGTRVGDLVRSLLKEPVADEKLEGEAELLLLYAARIQHLRQLILPALKCGDWVLSDRFELSTWAYQGGGRGLDWNFIQQLSAHSLQGFIPDLTFFLAIDPQLGLERVSLRGPADRMESESLAFFQRVDAAYYKAIESMDKVIVIDASLPMEKVQESIITHLEFFFHASQNA